MSDNNSFPKERYTFPDGSYIEYYIDIGKEAKMVLQPFGGEAILKEFNKPEYKLIKSREYIASSALEEIGAKKEMLHALPFKIRMFLDENDLEKLKKLIADVELQRARPDRSLLKELGNPFEFDFIFS